MKFQDLTGKKINHLTVISKAYRDNYNHWYWNCKCDCGKEIVVAGCNLRDGRAKSCGCWKSNRAKALNKTHGMKKEHIYNIWARMKQRCNNPQTPNYKNYGGRGIKVCKDWEVFENFYRDVSAMPNFNKTGYSLDRIDNNGDYEPTNCRWATTKEQANNRRTNRLITIDGETHTVKQWCEIRGLKSRTVYYRLNKGWNEKEALEFS